MGKNGRIRECVICGEETNFKEVIHAECLVDVYFQSFLTGRSVKDILRELGVYDLSTYNVLSARFRSLQRNGRIMEILSRKFRERTCKTCEAYRGLRYIPFAQKKLLSQPVILS